MSLSFLASSSHLLGVVVRMGSGLVHQLVQRETKTSQESREVRCGGREGAAVQIEQAPTDRVLLFPPPAIGTGRHRDLGDCQSHTAKNSNVRLQPDEVQVTSTLFPTSPLDNGFAVVVGVMPQTGT